MSCVVGIDTGKRACGVSVWVDAHLLCASYCTYPTDGRENLTEIVEKTIACVHRFVSIIINESCDAFIEIPRTYGGRSSRGDANDLIAEALVAGALTRLPWRSRLIFPQDWKGNTPKDVTERQVKKLLAQEELSRIALPGRDKRKCSNVWDAIGIGLWACQQLGMRSKNF